MKPIFTDIHQIGIVVRDLRKTIKNFVFNYGIGPWKAWLFNSEIVEDMEVRGKKVNYSMLVATCKSGNIDWEIIEPLDNISIYSEFLSKYGEGLQHINYIVDNYDKVVKYLKNNAVDIIQYGNLVGKHIYAYFDSEHDAKHIIEISANLPDFKRKEPLFVYPEDIKRDSKLKPMFDRTEAIGMVVKNVEETAYVLSNKYTLGPWKFYSINPGTVKDIPFYGKEKAFSFDIAVCKIGEAKLKLVGPKRGKTIFSEHFSKFGEGLHHVCFSVNSLNEVTNKLKGDGKRILQAGNWQDKNYAFFSTQKDLKFNACFYEKE